MTLVPNPAWETIGGKSLRLQKIQRPVICTLDDAYANYGAGKYDVVAVPSNSFNTPHGRDDVPSEATLSTRFISLNWAKPPFDNLQVRQAFALALNQHILVDRASGGAETSTNQFVPPGMPGYNANLRTPHLTVLGLLWEMSRQPRVFSRKPRLPVLPQVSSLTRRMGIAGTLQARRY
jgi:peptide/nickel transport system substrate-binding protein/oligopeptide transport system substrate-binding protein